MRDLIGNNGFNIVPRALRRTISSENMSLLTAAAVLCSTQMILGYAVVDELVVYAVLGLLLLAGQKAARSAPHPWPITTPLFKLHRTVFLLFTAYCLFQVVRGAVALGDIREIRFVLMFGALWLIAWLRVQDAIEPARMARIIVFSTAIYLTLYIGSGVFAEWILGVDRFAGQGHFWSGTAVAMFPVFVVLPALIALPLQCRTEHWLFWYTYVLIAIAAFYYQSRIGWVALAVFLVTGASRLGWRRLLAASGVAAAFALYFPWDQAGLLPPPRLASSIWGNMTRTSPAMIGDKFRELEGTMPSFRRDSTARALAHDVDRVIALKAAWCSATQGTAVRFLFGTGYWTHRYELLGCIHSIAAASGYEFPPSYREKVRTATFNGMLVDTGVVGLGLFAAIFILTGWSIARSSGGPRATSFGCLGLVAMSLFLSLNYDVMLLYFVLMPGGTLLLLHSTGTSTE